MGQPSEAERVRSYIIAQANKLSLPDLVAKVRADTAPLQQAAESVPPAHFFERPNPDDWSAAEVFTHILDMNDIGAACITGVLDSGKVPDTVRDLMTGGTREGLQSAADFWKVYLEKREPLLERVLQARGAEHPEAKITHQMFGDFTWREWLLFMRVHDLDHMRQLQSNAAHFGAG